MWFLIGFIVLVLVEILLLIQIGGAIGLWLTLAWILLTGGLGVILLKGVAMIGGSSLSFRVEEFHDPFNPIAHRGLVLIAGLFLILPGFVTDTIGLLLLFPPIRRGMISLIAWRFRAMQEAGTVSVVIDGEWQDVSSSQGVAKPDQTDHRS